MPAAAAAAAPFCRLEGVRVGGFGVRGGVGFGFDGVAVGGAAAVATAFVELPGVGIESDRG